MVTDYLKIDVHLLLSIIIDHDTILDMQPVSSTLQVQGNLPHRSGHAHKLK